MLANSAGTHRLLRHRARQRRALRLRLHLGGLRRPAGAPPARDVLGQRQSDRAARLLRRVEALRRSPDVRVPAQARCQCLDRAHLQHLRPAHEHRRRPRRARVHRRPRWTSRRCPCTATASRRGRSATSPTSSPACCLVALDREADGQVFNLGNPARDNDARARRADRQSRRPRVRERRAPATRGRRPGTAQAGHRQNARPLRLGTRKSASMRDCARHSSTFVGRV